MPTIESGQYVKNTILPIKVCDYLSSSFIHTEVQPNIAKAFRLHKILQKAAFLNLFLLN